MCGIAGVLGGRQVDEAIITRMARAVAHRGPDDEGIWIDTEARLAFGHRRLAIVDLSPSGREPMLSADGRLVLTFNGEIYNHAELRRALEAENAMPEGGWRGHSDTEVFIEGISH